MWIRPGSEVVYRPSRRAVSLPADDLPVRFIRYDKDTPDDDSPGTSMHARTVVGYANEDTNAMAALSKRNDRDFLHGVAAKMASLTSPTSVYIPQQQYHTENNHLPVRRKPPISNSNHLRRSAVLTPEDNMEIAAYLQRTPWSATTASHRRSSSVPPLSVSGSTRPSVSRWYPSSSAHYGRSAGPPASWSAGPGYHGRLPSRHSAGEWISAQRDLDDLDTLSMPAGHVIHTSRVGSVPPSAYFARTRPGSIAVTNGYTATHLARPYTRASYAGPYSSYMNDVDLDLELDAGPLSALRRDTKSALSRYSLPPAAPSNGPKHLSASQLDQKYGQILSSMHAQQRVQPRSEYNYSTSSLPGGERKARRPEVSETRKKLRELLCRSRNDPHYFDN